MPMRRAVSGRYLIASGFVRTTGLTPSSRSRSDTVWLSAGWDNLQPASRLAESPGLCHCPEVAEVS
jgi:hypothetical protein